MRQSPELREFLEIPSPDREYLAIALERDAYEKALMVFKWGVIPIIGLGEFIIDCVRRIGLPTVTLVSPKVARNLNFPSGGAVSNVLHRRHPCRDITFFQVAEFNQCLLRDKISELARVMIAAGATTFDIAANMTKAEEIAIKAGATLKGPLEKEFGGSFQSSHKSAMNIIWKYEGAGKRSSALPDNLVWYNREPEWDVIWNSAIHNEAKRHDLEVKNDSSLEIDGNLAAKFAGAGFNLGGDIKEVGSANLSVKVTFGG